jgi:hypothetical protein
MSLYRKVPCRTWRDRTFRELSAPAVPNAQHLYLYLTTGPESVALPGAVLIGRAALAEALGWPDGDGFEACLNELRAAGLVLADWRARLAWCPKALQDNPPQSAKVAIAWGRWLAEFFDCELGRRIENDVTDLLKQCDRGSPRGGAAFVEAFQKAFREALPEAYREGMANTEAEAEPEAEAEAAHPPAAPADVLLELPVIESRKAPTPPDPRPAGELELERLDLPVIQSTKSPNPTTWTLTGTVADALGAPHGMTRADVFEIARDYAAKVAAHERKPYTFAGARGGMVEWVRRVADRRLNGARRPAAARVGANGDRCGGFHPSDVRAFSEAAEWPDYVEAMLARPSAELVRFDAWRDQRKAASP